MAYGDTKKSVTAEARALKARLKGKGWKIRVWKNIGWYFSLQNGIVNLNEGGDKYFTLISDHPGDPGGLAFWTDTKSHRDPNVAVRRGLAKARSVVAHLDSVLTAAEDAVQG